MGQAHLFLVGLFAALLAASWYDDHVERARLAPPAAVGVPGGAAAMR